MNALRMISIAVSTLVFALAMVSCNRSSQDKSVGPASPIREVRLGYFANVTHAQAVLGVASGDFARAVSPAILSTKVFNAGPSFVEALLAGQIDVGYVGPGPALNAQSKTHGQGIRVIAAAAENGVIIVARDGSGINTLADLKDKKVATPQRGNTQDLAARHYLHDVLHQTDLQNVLPIPNSEQSGMMSRGQIDAAWAPEPWGSVLLAQNGAHVVGEEKDLWPEKKFTLTVLVTTPDFLSAHPDVIESLLRVHQAWTKKLQEEPEKQIPQLDAALYSLTSRKLPAGVLSQALARVKFANEPLVQTFECYGAWSYELGFTSQKPDLSGLIDTSILQKLQREVLSPASKESANASDPAAR